MDKEKKRNFEVSCIQTMGSSGRSWQREFSAWSGQWPALECVDRLWHQAPGLSWNCHTYLTKICIRVTKSHQWNQSLCHESSVFPTKTYWVTASCYTKTVGGRLGKGADPCLQEASWERLIQSAETGMSSYNITRRGGWRHSLLTCFPKASPRTWISIKTEVRREAAELILPLQWQQTLSGYSFYGMGSVKML